MTIAEIMKIADLPTITLFKRVIDDVYGLGQIDSKGKWHGIIISHEMAGRIRDLADELNHLNDNS